MDLPEAVTAGKKRTLKWQCFTDGVAVQAAPFISIASIAEGGLDDKANCEYIG